MTWQCNLSVEFVRLLELVLCSVSLSYVRIEVDLVVQPHPGFLFVW